MRRGKAAQSEKQQQQQQEGSGNAAEGEEEKSKPSYFDAVKIIGTVHTVEQFWSLYDHLVRPSSLPTTTDYHCFREGIQPTWEDPSNARGGKWIVRLKKGLASRYWEEIVLAMIGGQFSQVPSDEICGAVVSIRFSEDIVSVWNKTANSREITERVRDAIKRILHLPNSVHMEYKPHQDSLMDKSSFRNTQVWRPKSLEGRSDREGGIGAGRGGSRNREGGEHYAEREPHSHTAPPRRTASWGEREEGRGGKPKGRTEVERAWR
eukprot:CCRYP_002741-RB/>CCRYP_002741-RB protein AED:0.04 eAED:0.04 QI:362/1/1/1/1/1/2/244/263